MTSAVRDAANGAEFARRVEDVLGFEARVLSGDEEARLTFAGATSLRHGTERVLVIDVGGGSTELVLGRAGEVSGTRRCRSASCATASATCTPIRRPPPSSTRSARTCGLGDVPAATVDVAIAVAGTPTQAAAIDLGLTVTTRSGSRATSSRPRPWPNSWIDSPRSRSPSGGMFVVWTPPAHP